MRVALISFDFGEYCIRLASALAAEHDVLLLLPNHLAQGHLQKLNPAVDFRPFDRPRIRQPLAQVSNCLRMVRQVRAFSPDVIHFQHSHPWFNLALPLLGSTPLVVTIHDVVRHRDDDESLAIPQWLTDLSHRRADHVIVHAEALGDLARQRFGLAPDRVHVVPMILHGEDDRSREVRDDGVSVLFHGRIWGYKGLEYLVRAEPLITEAVPGARIVIAGKGEDLTRYREMMVHPDRFVVINEFISDEQRTELFREAAVVALPYVEASQSGVIPLAYNAGKPVVATTVGGLPEIVDDGLTGFLVPPRDAEALAQAIVTLLRDAPLRRAMGQAGRNKIFGESAPEAVAARTVAVYRAALGKAATADLVPDQAGER